VTKQRIGMMARQAPDQRLINYHQVESVAEYVAKVQQLGGKVIVPKSPVPGIGWFAQCLDTEGNAFALWESDTSAA
jgi:predicted enzyme related to lactoylglutathione lyase